LTKVGKVDKATMRAMIASKVAEEANPISGQNV
jgi:hypothetical protein